MRIINKKIKVYEMTCSSCEGRVEKAVKELDGVISVKASFKDETAHIEYDDELCSLDDIKEYIQKSGYSIKESNDYKFMGIVIIAVAIFLLGQKTGGFDMQARLTNASYAVLFIVGVLTSVHCVGMCGGIMLSQTVSKENIGLLPETVSKKNIDNRFDSVRPSLLYNAGRVLSYTILGGIIGAFGSVFSLSIMTKAGLQIFAAVFMIIMGLNMAGFKAFRSLQIKLPASACKSKNKSRSPFIVGILNGFMPCGPLQTMQLFALGTASASKGALSMFMFSLGTVPLMMTFGALAGILTKGYTKKMLKFSGVLIIALGLIMANRGFALAGVNINPFTSFASSTNGLFASDSRGSANVSKAVLEDGIQIITMTADNNGYTPNVHYVQTGIPVKWIINVEQLNSCNNAIVFQNNEYPLKNGENIIEFTPGDKDINFSCWMGMIPGVIKVTDDLDSVDITKNDPSLPAATTGPSCCAAPIGEDGSEPVGETGVYGDDITKVPTDLLINKASSDGGSMQAVFTGQGYDLQPLIIITENGLSTQLTFDLTDFEEPEGEYIIIDQTSGEEVTSFSATSGINSVEFSPSKTGGYIILKDNEIMGMIEVVDDLQASDPEPIRNKYLGAAQ